MNYTNKHAQEGFTLIEILIAFALVAVLGGVAYVSYSGIVERNSKTATIETMRVLRDGLERYRDDVGEYPASLKDLVKKPTDEKATERWEGPYVETKRGEIKDAWGQPFYYAPTAGGDNEYELYSYGNKKGKNGPKDKKLDAWKKL